MATFKDTPLIAFLPTDNPDLSLTFYRDTLGLELLSDEPFALVFKLDQRTLRIAKMESFTPQPFTVLGWHVDDIETTVDELTEKGVELKRYDGMDQDERGIWAVPNGPKIAWFTDPVGNVLSLTAF